METKRVFNKALGIMGIALLILFVVLPFVSGAANIPEDVTAHSIGILIHQFIVYWKEVVSLI